MNMSQGLEVAVLEMEKRRLAVGFRHSLLNKVVSDDHAAWHSQVNEDL